MSQYIRDQLANKLDQSLFIEKMYKFEQIPMARFLNELDLLEHKRVWPVSIRECLVYI